MFASLSRITTRLVPVSCLLLVACSSAPILESRSAAVPAGLDLTGYWLVRNDPKADYESAAGSVQDRLISTRKSRRNRGGTDGSAQVFLEFGDSLKITQTRYGLFISYDRSVVEEFTFGENRLVTVGPIEARRVSGWDGDSFVVETLDDTGTTLSESWQLDENGSVLVRKIRIRKGDTDSFSHRQILDRQ